jgi:hypothetical protein
MVAVWTYDEAGVEVIQRGTHEMVDRLERLGLESSGRPRPPLSVRFDYSDDLGRRKTVFDELAQVLPEPAASDNR